MLLILLIILILVFGGYGMSPINSYGAVGYSPVLLLVLLVIVLVMFGGLRLR